MNSDNTAKLLNTYPLLYRELREWGFECGDGWFDLLWYLSADIEATARLEGIPETADSWPSVRILKQKFGMLRVQFDKMVSAQIEALVAKACESSMGICEMCGASAQRDIEHARGGCVETLCENCRKEHRPPVPRDKTVLPVWMQERNSHLK